MKKSRYFYSFVTSAPSTISAGQMLDHKANTSFICHFSTFFTVQMNFCMSVLKEAAIFFSFSFVVVIYIYIIYLYVKQILRVKSFTVSTTILYFCIKREKKNTIYIFCPESIFFSIPMIECILLRIFLSIEKGTNSHRCGIHAGRLD